MSRQHLYASRAWFSFAKGTPNIAIIASPIYLLIIPLCLTIHCSMPEKYLFNKLTTCFGLICSDRVVNPLMSQKRTVAQTVSPPRFVFPCKSQFRISGVTTLPNVSYISSFSCRETAISLNVSLNTPNSSPVVIPVRIS